MCGIIGYVGEEACAPILLRGLEKMEYRGYDSAGIAVLENRRIEIYKEKGRLAALAAEIRDGMDLTATTGIGHTRWATHGKPSKENAHPLLSNNGKFAIVHNGIIENFAELRSDLTAKGYGFQSQTDSEVVAVLLEENDTGEPLETIRRTVDMLKGTFSLGIMCADRPNELFCVRNASPLVIGLGAKEKLIASDVTPLLVFTKHVYQLADGEIAHLTPDTVEVFDSALHPVQKKVVTVNWSVETAEKGGYDHFMLKEIMEQPTALKATLDPRVRDGRVVLPELHLTPEEIRGLTRICIVACGSAYHVGMVGKYVLESLLRLPVEVDVASEFRYRSPILDDRTLCIIISQSGETADTLAALREANQAGAHTVSVVNVVGSTIANESQSVLYTWAGPEIAVATTKAYSTQLVLLYAFGLYLADLRGALTPDQYDGYLHALMQLPEQLREVLKLEPQLAELAQRYAYLKDAYFIGRNIDYAVSMEASLKLKEISYIHSEAYPAGELKHGTISLIEEGTFVMSIVCTESVIDKMISNMKEVRARGAEVLALTTDEYAARVRAESDNVIAIPRTNALFMASLEVVPLQLLSYHIAKARHCDIDKPRNLAKSVTVE